MKKGFTMIELIFVIVILGILASVAIPRLAATREDAEVAATVANLRTLISDAAAYRAAKGNLKSTNWRDFTNVPLKGADQQVSIFDTPQAASLKVGDNDECIRLQLAEKDDKSPAHIVFSKESATAGTVCTQVQNSEPLKAYFDSKVSYTNDKAQQTISSAIAIGSSTSVYTK